MPLNGFYDIWKKLQNIEIDEELYRLDELARFPREHREGEESKLDTHWRDHHYIYNSNGNIKYDLTKDEYDDITHMLSSYPAVPIGRGNKTDVHGYETQSGRRAKYIDAGDDYAFVAYLPNLEASNQHDEDVYGVAKTYFHRPLSDILLSANPYHLLEQGEGDHRYKCDIGGGFEGLKYLTPDKVTPSRRVSSEQAEEIAKKLRARQPLPIYRVGENNEN